MADDTEFGYTAKARPEVPPKRHVYYVCEGCGCDTVEMKWYCNWNVEKQRWEPCDACDEDECYCPDCGDQCSLEVRNYGS